MPAKGNLRDTKLLGILLRLDITIHRDSYWAYYYSLRYSVVKVLLGKPRRGVALSSP